MKTLVQDASIEKYKKILLEIIHKQLPEADVYLFGSRARHDNRIGSDFDIAIDAGHPIEQKKISRINENLEHSTIPFFIDIVDLQAATEDFKAFIKKDMVLWKN